jgi:hypothetical protein
MNDVADETPKQVRNTRWRKGAERYSTKRSLDDVRWIKGVKTEDSVTEVAFCERRHSSPGWHRGARVRKRP